MCFHTIVPHATSAKCRQLANINQVSIHPVVPAHGHTALRRRLSFLPSTLPAGLDSRLVFQAHVSCSKGTDHLPLTLARL